MTDLKRASLNGHLTVRHSGCGKFQYEPIEAWARSHIRADTAGVAVDSRDRVYALTRSVEHPVVVLDAEGNFISCWGRGLFKRAHAILAAPDDTIYCVDDAGHAVRRFTREGTLLMEICTAGRPADTGYVPGVLDSVARAGPPFNTPTGVAITSEGHLLVSDGYGNARIHRFTAEGELLSSFGEPGHGPGQFFLPHAVAVDSVDRIYVADRENSRVQIFHTDGKYLSEWQAPRASSIFIDKEDNIFVTEMGEIIQGPPGAKRLELANAPPRVTVRNTRGEIQAEILPLDPRGAGLFFSPHSITMDSRGNLYVSEVSDSFTGGLAPKDRPRLHKYVALAYGAFEQLEG